MFTRARWVIGFGLAIAPWTACANSSSDQGEPATPFVTVVVTATPTSTPVPTATPVPETAEVVLAALKASGIPIGESVVFTADSDPNKLLGRPNGYVGKINFLDTRLPRTRPAEFSTEDGGSIEVFATTEAAKARKDYIDALGKGSPIFVEYSYIKGRVLVRVSKELNPTQAGEYEAAVSKLRGN